MGQIGVGTWPLGGKAYGPVSRDDALDAIEEALGRGAEIFDTADIYGDGRAEELLGEALEGRTDVRIIGKAGYLVEGSREQDFSEGHLRSRLEASLRRLRRDSLDSLLLHSPPRAILEAGAALDVFERFQREGLVRTIGVSVASIDDADLALERGSIGCLEVIVNLLDQRALDRGLPARCRAQGVAFIARVPLCFGFLTGKFRPGQSIALGDQRARWSHEQRDRWARGAESFRFLEREGRSLAQAALGFLLSAPGCIPIPGVKDRAQATHNLQAEAISDAEFDCAREVWRTQRHLVP
jgi:aryl-alcohol dehydrogenase-like predicted oxidoreductase